MDYLILQDGILKTIHLVILSIVIFHLLKRTFETENVVMFVSEQNLAVSYFTMGDMGAGV